MSNCDLTIIGAGPAGMSAAITARSLGLSVTVLDEQPTPGGQVYRNIGQFLSPARAAVLGKDYLKGRALAEAFAACGANYIPRATVWRVGQEGVAWSSASTGGQTSHSSHVLIATGAMERPMPLLGWTLPGVMTAGAAQILLKTTGHVQENAVFAGSGPLLYLVVSQYLKAGAKIAAVLDTTPPGALAAALPHLPSALRRPGLLAKGMGLLHSLRRSGVPWHKGVAEIEILGTTEAQAVRWRNGRGEHQLATKAVFLHQGVIPNVNAAMSAGAKHHWDDLQACWRPDLSPSGRSSEPWLFIAGDGGGIGGALAAAHAGRLAAFEIAQDLGRSFEPHLRSTAARALSAELAPRPFLDRLYRPAAQFFAGNSDEVILCRCEAVRRGDLRQAIAEGCTGPNQFKAFTRAGMGPCQGRMCGHSISAGFAALQGCSPQQSGYYSLRSPIKPVTAGDLLGQPD